jgi:hypothetical protein
MSPKPTATGTSTPPRLCGAVSQWTGSKGGGDYDYIEDAMAAREKSLADSVEEACLTLPLPKPEKPEKPEETQSFFQSLADRLFGG